MSERRVSPVSFIKHAADVASFYGFRPMRDIERLVPRIERVRGTHSFATTTQVCSACTAQKQGEPVLAYYATPSPSNAPAHLPARETGEFGLQVVGSSESLGEVLLLKTLFAIITEWGARVARVRINALGDRDSKARFERELAAYLRKHASDLDEACREHIAANPFAPYGCNGEMCRQILENGPRAMNFLSERSRTHFREVLEHIEGLGFPYELDDLLMGDEREPRIAFTLDLENEDATILCGAGGRYDEYARRLTGKKDASAVSASIFFRRKGADRSSFSALPPARTPKVYFVQLGVRAKLQGLTVVDMLRAAHMPVSQSFDAKSLAPQLASARALGVSHLLIMGQREALDGTVIVRSANDSSQTVVPLTTLPRFLKALH